MKYYFVRHGQSTANVAKIIAGATDPELTDEGRLQAKRASKQLKDKDITLILSSPRIRALETAQIIAKELGVTDVRTVEDLRERGLGDAEGKPKDHESEWYFKNDSDFNFEPHAQIFERMVQLISYVRSIVPEQGNVLLVGHGTCGHFLQLTAKGITHLDPNDTIEEVKNANIVELEIV